MGPRAFASLPSETEQHWPAQPCPVGPGLLFPQTLKGTKKASPEALLTYLELRRKHLSPLPHGRALGGGGHRTSVNPLHRNPPDLLFIRENRGPFTVSEFLLRGVSALRVDWSLLSTDYFVLCL
uniref:Uncharacterized protein n=1 Tax=Myotis myotis TaxID=51298 RepID=A0A7J7WIB6_MYOMY|nr:hypothetical protein mMyoMyo1_012160 [Myotis myotis]